jgi:hypothetical protein
MGRRLIQIAGLAIGGALVVWAARVVAHSKVPPPEGHWRELDLEEL